MQIINANRMNVAVAILVSDNAVFKIHADIKDSKECLVLTRSVHKSVKTVLTDKHLRADLQNTSWNYCKLEREPNSTI